MSLNVVNEVEAKEVLVKRHITSFGPATENDAVWWTGFLKGEVRGILEGLRDQITQIEVPNMKDTYLNIKFRFKTFAIFKT